MKILALDLGKFKSVACDYETATGRHSFATGAVTMVSARVADFWHEHKGIASANRIKIGCQFRIGIVGPRTLETCMLNVRSNL